MKIEDLREWAVSEYNEDTPNQLDYYLNEDSCEVGDVAYLYSHEDNELTRMQIVHLIARSNDWDRYSELLKNPDVLIDGEDEYEADTSAEFITDNDCYLVWFKYLHDDLDEDDSCFTRIKMERKVREYVTSDTHKIEDYSDIEICCKIDEEDALRIVDNRIQIATYKELEDFCKAIDTGTVDYMIHGCR